MSAPSTERGDSEQTRYAWRVLSVTSLGVLLTALNSSTLDVALPAVVRGIHTPVPARPGGCC